MGGKRRSYDALHIRNRTAPNPWKARISSIRRPDCFSRKAVDWSIADHMRADLVADALRMTARNRGGQDGAA
ncbi:hypothetical protein ACWGQ5_43885 [Streptomyces sp. NPDC055722]